MQHEGQEHRFIDAMLRPGSEADAAYRRSVAAFERSRARTENRLGPNDLFRHGGRVVPHALFRNVFLGGPSMWNESDAVQIDDAIAGAASDRRLENVMRQYFGGHSTSCERDAALFPVWKEAAELSRSDVRGLLQSLFDDDPFLARDLDVTIFNIVLPRSVVLRSETTTSRAGLAGFHGSVPVRIGDRDKFVYYSVSVFSERRPDGQENGIPFFGAPWKNVVATLYHQINEFRTDPDVERANAAATEAEAFDLAGWVSNAGEEVADQPLSAAGSLADVFAEVMLSGTNRRVPVQFMYSNVVHGAQGPVELASDATRRRGHGVGLRGIAAVHGREGRFGLLFPELAERGNVAPFPEDLGLPGGPMDGGLAHDDSSTLFAVMTYFAQFLDHDITFDPTSILERQQDPTAVRNFRTPALELDSVYGAGPTASPFLYDQAQADKMLLGRATNDPAQVDLPRNSQGVALIGDPRNDENLIVSQLHFAFLKFHNAIVDQLGSIDDGIDDETPFTKAQRLVRWHYQWLVLHEFLPAIVGSDTLGDVLRNGRKIFVPLMPFVPVEFSVAAYRFGHAMVQPGYVVNDTFGAPLFPADANAPAPAPGQPRADLRGGPIRLEERVNWKNFVDTGAPPSPAEAATRFSSKIDTRLSGPLLNLPASVIPAGVPAPLRSLAVRNLGRGVALELPSGLDVAQAVAKKVDGIRVLTDDEIWAAPQVRRFRGSSAPLWYYVLREAELLAGGEHLGPVGGRIVAEVIVGLLDLDPSSYRSVEPDWKPVAPGRADDARFTFVDLFKIAGTDVA